MQYADHYLVTEPGTTPLRPGQWLSAEELEDAGDRFGTSSFAALAVADMLDDWLSAPVSAEDASDPLTRLIALHAVLGLPRPSLAEAEDATVVELCRLAATRFDRLGRLRRLGAPDIVRRNERRMLSVVARALVTAVLAECPREVASAA